MAVRRASLYAKEKESLPAVSARAPIFFAGGAAFAYFVAMPWALQFLLSYQGDVGGVSQEALPAVGNYLNFVTRFLFGFGAAFLLPILLMILERAGIVRESSWRSPPLRRRRRGCGFRCPDPARCCVDAAYSPLYALYEFAILAIRLTHWRARREEAARSTPGCRCCARNRRGPRSATGGGRLAVLGPFKRIARAGGKRSLSELHNAASSRSVPNFRKFLVIAVTTRPNFKVGETRQINAIPSKLAIDR